MNGAPLIAFTDSEMKYVERLKSTTPKLICMVMNMFLWESEMIPHELVGGELRDTWNWKSLGMGGEREERALIKAIVSKFTVGVNLPWLSLKPEKGGGAVIGGKLFLLQCGFTGRYCSAGIRMRLGESESPLKIQQISKWIRTFSKLDHEQIQK